MPQDARPGAAGQLRASMAALLMDRITESDQGAESISVAELHKVLLPYHECRDRLGLASKGEYDVALLGLLSDSAVVRVDEDLASAVERELATPEPGLAVLKNFAAARLELRTASSGPDAGVEPGSPAESEPEPEEAPEPADPVSPAVHSVDPDAATPAEPATEGATQETTSPTCLSCEGVLPVGPDIRFCPHCGVDQTTPRCAGCRGELESEWSYCPRCGREARG